MALLPEHQFIELNWHLLNMCHHHYASTAGYVSLINCAIDVFSLPSYPARCYTSYIKTPPCRWPLSIRKASCIGLHSRIVLVQRSSDILAIYPGKFHFNVVIFLIASVTAVKLTTSTFEILYFRERPNVTKHVGRLGSCVSSFCLE